MAVNTSNSSNLERLVLKGLITSAKEVMFSPLSSVCALPKAGSYKKVFKQSSQNLAGLWTTVHVYLW